METHKQSLQKLQHKIYLRKFTIAETGKWPLPCYHGNNCLNPPGNERANSASETLQKMNGKKEVGRPWPELFSS